MLTHPLIEVFGYSVTDMSPVAMRHRANSLCPFHNSSGLRCTKDSKTDPLGVCTVSHKDAPAITCPVRFRQDMLIVEDAARFFFPPKTRFLPLTEVRLKDKNGKSAGNIDMVLVALDDNDRVVDFGALEVQAVYISGNVKKPFKQYMSDPAAHADMDWLAEGGLKPDCLSSWKHLAQQIKIKGHILNRWGKKMTVAIDRHLFEKLPPLLEVKPARANFALMVYEIVSDRNLNQYALSPYRTIYSKFEEIFASNSDDDPSGLEEFIKQFNV